MSTSIGKRFAEERKRMGMSQRAIAERIGISLKMISRYEGDKSVPSGDVLAKLAAIGADVLYILTGKRADGPPARAGDEPVGRASARHAFAYLPLYGIEASAGYGTPVEHERVREWLAFRTDWLRREFGITSPEALQLVMVTGDSMEPTLHEGDVVMIDLREHARTPREGLFVVRIGDGVMVKRLQWAGKGRLRLTSDNPAYDPIEVALNDPSEDVAIIGRVVWIAKRV